MPPLNIPPQHGATVVLIVVTQETYRVDKVYMAGELDRQISMPQADKVTVVSSMMVLSLWHEEAT
jgi:hypothetical protein